MSDTRADAGSTEPDLLAGLADEFTLRCRKGERPGVDEFARMHPELAAEIRELFPAILAMEGTATTPAPRGDDMVGTDVGRYRLLERIGEGGYGVVYMAEQQHPVRRKVALKVIKPGLDTRQVIARFEAERQALALMEHENIAKVLDGGTTETGRPYFVMELVRGVPITRYCDENRLAPRVRLELFVQVCRAVQHAHTKGIIHRDIKPTNVLVTMRDGAAVPKVIDFGIAKATGQQQLTELTLFTNFAQMVGTPLYMSPEQAEMSAVDVDTRSDVYSLGVLLYELLTGTTPFDGERLKSAAFDEVRRIIREEEPPRPSTRLTTSAHLASIAATRGVEPRRLSALVKGELDWIVMRALEKDRSRRYETANGLARDVERYLSDEVVEARPASRVYRLGKFVRRHKAWIVTTAAFLVALALIAGNVIWSARDRALRHAALQQAINNALAEVETQYRLGRLVDAQAAFKRADVLSDGNATAVGEQLGQRIATWRVGLELVRELEEIRLGGRVTGSIGFHELYGAAFRGFGIDVESLEASEAALRIRASPIRQHLVNAIDHWMASPTTSEALRMRPRLAAIAKAVDPDPLRDRLRDALVREDLVALGTLVRDVHALTELQSAHFYAMLAEQANRNWLPEWAQAVAVLRRGQSRYPEDFWLNLTLARTMLSRPTSQGGELDLASLPEPISFARAAVALRPNNLAARRTLAGLLSRAKDTAAAEVEFREAMRVNPKDPGSYFDLIDAHQRAGDDASARAVAVEMARLEWPADVHLSRTQRFRPFAGWERERIAAFRDYLRLRPSIEKVRLDLAELLRTTGALDEAVGEYREALRRKPTGEQAARVRLGLARILQEKGRLTEALAEMEALADIEAMPGLAGLRIVPDATLYDAARFCAGALKSPAARQDAALREGFGARGVGFLLALEKQDYFRGRHSRVQHMKRAADLAPLRARADFAELVARLDAIYAEQVRARQSRPAPAGGPFGGVPAAVPGLIQAEHFDEGGEGVGYHDLDDVPRRVHPRPDTPVLIVHQIGIHVQGIFSGEWLRYTTRVEKSGDYVLEFKNSSPGSGSSLRVEFDGREAVGRVEIPATGSWEKWQTTSTPPVRLEAGVRVMRVYFEADDGLFVCNLDWIRLRTAGADGK